RNRRGRRARRHRRRHGMRSDRRGLVAASEFRMVGWLRDDVVYRSAHFPLQARPRRSAEMERLREHRAARAAAARPVQTGVGDSPLDTLSGNPAPVAMWGAAKDNLWVGGNVNRQVPPAGDGSAPTTAQDPLLLHWDGSTWARVDLPIAAGNGQRGVRSIWGSAANDVWAVG